MTKWSITKVTAENHQFKRIVEKELIGITILIILTEIYSINKNKNKEKEDIIFHFIKMTILMIKFNNNFFNDEEKLKSIIPGERGRPCMADMLLLAIIDIETDNCRLLASLL